MDVLVFFINKVLIAVTVLGSIYALGAIGVTLIFGILRFAHFAHGDMMTLGAFFAFHFATVTHLPVGAGGGFGVGLGAGVVGFGGGFGSGAGSVVMGGRPPPAGAWLMVVTSWS